MARGSSPSCTARQNMAVASVPADVAMSGAYLANESVATSRNDATMTRSVPSAAGELAGQELLVGLDGRRGLLDVEVERDMRVVVEDVEHLGERGHAEFGVAGARPRYGYDSGCEALGLVSPGHEPVGIVEGSHLGQGHGVDGTVAVGGPVHRAVVTDHEMAIGGGMDVELDPGHTQLERTAQGEQRRRRRLPGAALVRIGRARDVRARDSPRQGPQRQR